MPFEWMQLIIYFAFKSSLCVIVVCPPCNFQVTIVQFIRTIRNYSTSKSWRGLKSFDNRNFMSGCILNPQQEIWYNLYIGLFSPALDVISTNGLLLRVPEVYARSPPKNQSWWCMNSRRLWHLKSVNFALFVEIDNPRYIENITTNFGFLR